MFISVFEFCISNEYVFEGKSWNCINYLLNNHSNLLDNKDIKHLKALNSSYMSLYKVISVNEKGFIVLKNLIEHTSSQITVYNKDLNIESGDNIACRVLALSDGQYELSEAVVAITEQQVAMDIVINVHYKASLMKTIIQRKIKNLKGYFSEELLIKKMWTKEILTIWYIFNASCSQINRDEMLDEDGNPYKPYLVIFDIKCKKKELKQVIDSFPEFIKPQSEDINDMWLWVDNKYERGKDKIHLKEQADGSEYKIFAGLEIEKHKLIIDVQSKQHAHIAQDHIETILKDMVSNPIIVEDD